MQLFGLSLNRTSKLQAAMAAAAQPPTDDSGERESVKFGKAYAKSAAKEMLETLARNSTSAERNTKLALYVSIPHQAMFLFGLVPIQFDSVAHAMESITMIALAFALPWGVDQLILMCVRIIAARAAATLDKWKAAAVLVPAVIASGTVNFIAPGPLILRLAAAGIVALVPLSQVVRSCRPSFRKVGEMENDIAAEVADLQQQPQPTVGSRKPDQAELDARKRAGYDKKSPTDKAAWTKKYLARVAAQAAKAAATAAVANVTTAQDLLDAAGPLDDAPVSGAPVGAKA